MERTRFLNKKVQGLYVSKFKYKDWILNLKRVQWLLTYLNLYTGGGTRGGGGGAWGKGFRLHVIKHDRIFEATKQSKQYIGLFFFLTYWIISQATMLQTKANDE